VVVVDGSCTQSSSSEKASSLLRLYEFNMTSMSGSKIHSSSESWRRKLNNDSVMTSHNVFGMMDVS